MKSLKSSHIKGVSFFGGCCCPNGFLTHDEMHALPVVQDDSGFLFFVFAAPMAL